MGAPSYNNFRNLITFSRGSNATLFDSTGRLTYGPNNLILQSQTFNTGWALVNVTVSPNTAVAPDGTLTADSLFETSATNIHQAYQSISAISGVRYAASVYVKYVDRQWIYIGNTAAAVTGVWFDIQNGVVGTQESGKVGAITAVGNGWYRCTVFATASAASWFMTIQGASADGVSNYTGDPSKSYLIWGAQLEAVTYQTTPSTYVATTASAYYGPRLDYDPVTLALRGMLVEEQRTSAITGVTNFNPVNTTGFTTFGDAAGTLTVVSDTEALTAAGLIGTCTSGTVFKMDNSAGTTPFYARTTNAITLGVSVTWAMSVYARGSGTFTIDVNAGTWTGSTSPALTSSYQRISSVGSSNTSSNQFRVAAAAGAVVYFILMQAEQGAFPTSIIPNTGASSVIRNADNATMSGSQFTPWYNVTQGTLVLSWMAGNVIGLSNTLFYLDDNDGTQYQNVMSSRQSNGVTPTAGIQFNVRDNSVDQAAINTTTPTLVAGSVYRAAPAYAPSNFAVCINSGTVATDTSGTVPAGVDMLRIAGHRDGTRLNGWIRSIAYYPRRLSDTQLQRLTA